MDEENQLSNLLNDVTTYNIIKLIAEVMQCVENTETKQEAIVDIMSDDLMVVTIDDKRFRILVSDCSRFN